MRYSSWRQLTLITTAVIIGVPLLIICWSMLQLLWTDDLSTLSHLWDTVVPEYIRHSLILLVGVAVGVVVLGVSTAWLTTACRFPGQRLLSWALLLPLRSEEHTSELQSRPHLVCRLLLEKKNSTEDNITKQICLTF